MLMRDILLQKMCIRDSVSASLYSQTKLVSLQMKNATLEEVIHALKQQTEIGFFYNIDHEEIKKVKDITLDVKDVHLKDVLASVLKGTKLEYSIIKMCIRDRLRCVQSRRRA